MRAPLPGPSSGQESSSSHEQAPEKPAHLPVPLSSSDQESLPSHEQPSPKKRAHQPDPSSDQESSSLNEQPPKKKVRFLAPTPPPPHQSTTAPLPPATQPAPLRVTRLHVAPLYDRDSFEAAVTMRESGLDFGDLRMVGWFNRAMWAEDRSRPGRNQKSLLKVSQMTWEEYDA